MKKLLCLASLLFLLAAPQVFGSDESILMSHSRRGNARSVVFSPQVILSNEVISISFYDSGIYSLTVEAVAGDCVYQAVLPADGATYSYDLSGLAPGDYCLVLEGPSGVYEGYFYLD